MAKVTRIEPMVAELKPRKKVAAYARVSRESDRLNHSLSAQISYYSNLIQKNPEWEFAGIFADSGISGTGTAKRPEFQRMLAECEAGHIDIILTKSISRMARNVVDLLETVRHLKSLGIDVWFEKENIRSLSADGELMLGILAGFAEEESRTISDNIKWSIKKKFQRGEQWHVPSYGYRWDGKTFVICEEQAKAIRRIFDDYQNDIPLKQTSRWLKEHGHACSTTFITYALQNVAYAGDLLLQRYYTENHRTHKTLLNDGQLPRYYVRDNHEPIIDRATFDKVQEKIRANIAFNSAAHRIVKTSCFSSKIICGKCGSHFIKWAGRINNYDGVQEQWACRGKHKKKICDARNIRGYRLRNTCCEVLGLKTFDEDAFARNIEKIVTTETDDLEFYFYDGTVRTATIQYFSKDQRRYVDSHKKVFGYQWSTEHGYVIVQEEAEGVRKMFRYYLDGMTLEQVAQKLKEGGYRSMRGDISINFVSRNLGNDFYLGIRRVRAQCSESGKEEIIENDHEPLVSREMFDAVQERKRRKCKGRIENAKRNGNTGQPE